MATDDSPYIARVLRDLEPLVPRYLEHRREDLAQLRQAATDGDFETVHLLGHRMKGSGAGYGFELVTVIGTALETAAKTKDLAGTHKQIEALARYLDRVEIIYLDD